MDDINQLINNITKETTQSQLGSLNLAWALKIPGIIILLANILFAILLFLRARILADTVTTPQNKIIKGMVIIYMGATIMGTLLTILFLILT